MENSKNKSDSDVSPSIDYSRTSAFYDRLVDVDFDIPFFEKHFADIVKKTSNAKCLELMAGTGRITVKLAKIGNVIVVDAAPSMLQLLNAKASKYNVTSNIEVICSDVLEISFVNEFPLVILPFNSFAELLSISAQKRLLEVVYRALVMDGLFICTLHNPTLRLEPVDGEKRVRKHISICENISMTMYVQETYNPDSRIVNGIQTFEERNAGSGAVLSVFEQPIKFRLTTKQEFREMARDVGFEIEEELGDYERSVLVDSSPFMIFCLRKIKQLRSY